MPSPFEKDVVRRQRETRVTDTAATSFSPLQNSFGTMTPNGLCFERHHAGVPNIDPDRHRLVIHGLVERPLVFSMDDLMRFPSVSRIAFLECSGNTLNWKNVNPDFGVQQTHGLLMCCEWTGVLLSTLLDEVGIGPDAKWVLAEGADAAAMTRSIPIAKALDDAIIVYGQNGERLRPEQGYPLRLLLPGYEGNMNVKWLRRLKLGDEPFETREETSKYTDLMPGGKARQFTFVMEAKSVITRPFGWPTDERRARILRDQRARLVRARTHRSGRGLDRWRTELVRRRAAGAGSLQGGRALSRALALGRQSPPCCKAEPSTRPAMSSRATVSLSMFAA